ncbi:MAG: hypothetical protein KDE27_04440, partial [Planctomycetes bacterium]|nr:hypothetical protein [Planctomycetota bacterium]
DLAKVPSGFRAPPPPERLLFSESQSRILFEVAPDRLDDFRANLHRVPCAVIGEVTAAPTLEFVHGDRAVAKLSLAEMQRAWQAPLDFDGTLTGGGAR